MGNGPHYAFKSISVHNPVLGKSGTAIHQLLLSNSQCKIALEVEEEEEEERRLLEFLLPSLLPVSSSESLP